MEIGNGKQISYVMLFKIEWRMGKWKMRMEDGAWWFDNGKWNMGKLYYYLEQGRKWAFAQKESVI